MLTGRTLVGPPTKSPSSRHLPDRVVESGSLHLKGQLHLRDFTYRDDYGDALTLTYAWVKDGRRYIHTQRIMRPMPDKRLVARWTTFRDRLVPGQQRVPLR